MSYQTGYIYAIVNTIERVKIPQLQEAIQRLNEKTKLVKSNNEIVAQVAKLDTDVATIMKKLNLVDGEFKDDDITLLQALSNKLETTTQTVNTISNDIVKLKNDYYHLINVEHLSTLTEDIQEVKEIAAEIQNFTGLTTKVNENTTNVIKAESRISNIDSYFNLIAEEKYGVTQTDKEEDKKDEEENGDGEGEQTGNGTNGNEEGIEAQADGDNTTGGSTMTEEQKRADIIQHNMQFIALKILSLMDLNERVGKVEGKLTGIDLTTLVKTSDIGNLMNSVNINVDKILDSANFSVATYKNANLLEWFRYILTFINMQYKTVQNEDGTTTVTKSLAEYVDELAAQLDEKYDDETKLSIDGITEKTIKEHLIDLFTKKFDANSTVSVNNVPKTIEAHLNDLSTSKYDASTKISTTADQTEGKTIAEHIGTLYSEIGVSSGSGSGNGSGNLAAQIDNLRQTKYDASTDLLVGGSNAKIPEHFGNLYTNKYDENTTLTIKGSTEKISTHLENLYTDKYDSSTTLTAGGESKTIGTHLDNLATNKYDASTEFNINNSSKTIEGHLNELSSNKFDASTKLTVGANNDEQTIKTHLDNLATNKYDENTEIAVTELNKKTIKNHLNALYNAKTDTDEKFGEINGVIGKWNDTSVGTTLGLVGENDNITGALEAIVSTTNNINSSMSLFNGSVATQNKVLLGNTYPSYNRNLVGLVNGANYEIITETEAKIIPDEDLNGQPAVLVNSLYLESFNDDVATKLTGIITDMSNVDATIRIRLGPSIMLGDFLNTSGSSNTYKLPIFTSLFALDDANTNKHIIFQCYASSLGEISVDDIKDYMKLLCTTLTPASYDITFIFYDYPPESTTVSELVTALDQATDSTTETGLGTSPINYHAKLVYLF